jgi:multiple sugar transport system ATP-binding protein
MAQIVLDKVRKDFGGLTVVSELSLSIDDGEFIVLVGPSGCGKSTTLRMVAGLEDTSGGTIHIGGRDVTMLEPKDRNVAMVFQNYALYPHKSVYENLAFGLRMRKTDPAEIERQVKWAAEMLGIENLLMRKPRQLSGGQMQRVSLGRALVRRPDAFLLDEPLSNLDAKLRVRMREEIGQLHERIGTSMIYVTHDQVEAMTLGDRIVVMNQGKMQQVGTPLEVYDYPVNRFVAGFIGAPEMNFIEGELTHDGRMARFRGAGIDVPMPADRLKRQAGGKAVLGIRPEHVALSDSGEIAATVRLVEQLGAQTLLVCDTGNGGSLRVLDGRLDGMSRQTPCRLTLTGEKLHLFDADSGESMLSHLRPQERESTPAFTDAVPLTARR